MKKFLSKKNGLVLLSILIIGAFFVVPHQAHAFEALDLLAKFFTGAQSVIYGWAGKVLYWVVLEPLSKILAISGGVLDILVKFSLNSKELYTSDGVTVGWTAFRDICNMIFIFVLIVASIKTILQSKVPKDTIKNVVLAAITINFSLYVTKFILDIANIFAVWLYNAILGLAGGANGLGSTLVGVMNISRFFGKNGMNPELVNDASAFIAVIVLSMVTIFVIIMVFKSALLFLSRTIAFVFHMIMSPLGLMSKFGLIPESFSKEYDWWDSVKKDALMPVVFFLLLYISLYFTSSIQGTFVAKAKKVNADNNQWIKTDVMKGNSFEMSDFIIFFLIYMLFEQCYKISKKYTSTIANQLEGGIKVLAGAAVGVASGGASFALRQSVGRIAAGEGASAWAASQRAKGTVFGRVMANTTDKLKSGSYNLSDSKIGSGLMKQVGISSKIDGKKFGIDAAVDMSNVTGRTGGYGDRNKVIDKEREEFLKKELEKFGTDAKGLQQRSEFLDNYNREQNSLKSVGGIRNKIPSILGGTPAGGATTYDPALKLTNKGSVEKLTDKLKSEVASSQIKTATEEKEKKAKGYAVQAGIGAVHQQYAVEASKQKKDGDGNNLALDSEAQANAVAAALKLASHYESQKESLVKHNVEVFKKFTGDSKAKTEGVLRTKEAELTNVNADLGRLPPPGYRTPDQQNEFIVLTAKQKKLKKEVDGLSGEVGQYDELHAAQMVGTGFNASAIKGMNEAGVKAATTAYIDDIITKLKAATSTDTGAVVDGKKIGDFVKEIRENIEGTGGNKGGKGNNNGNTWSKLGRGLRFASDIAKKEAEAEKNELLGKTETK